MHILFVDESGTPPPPEKASDTPLFVLGGISIPEHIWPTIANELAELKRDAGIEDEIKWRHFAPQPAGAKPNGLAHLDATKKELIRNQLYALISRYPAVKLIGVTVNVGMAYQREWITNADQLYWHAYQQLTHCFQQYLRDLQMMHDERVYGIIVCDHRAPKDDQRLREMHHQMLVQQLAQSDGHIALIEGVFIAPSHLSVGIQLADMVAGALFRAQKEKTPDFSIKSWGLSGGPSVNPATAK